MRLYHGSNVTVANPRLVDSGRTLDFGGGFYLTSDIDQAVRWARAVAFRRADGRPVVNQYIIDDDSFLSLDRLEFNTPSSEWLGFVVANRKRLSIDHGYDVISGPVADDTTSMIINLYIDGLIDEESAIRRLLPQRLSNQFAFKTERALDMLYFEKEVFS